MGWCSPSSSYPRPRFFWTWTSSRPTSRAWPPASRNPVKSLRPHAKAHKCVEIAKRQIAAGAIGVCVATVAEAELMAAAGIPGLLLTSPVADPLKMARIVKTGAMVVVDHLQQVAWYDEAASAANRKLDVLVDLDVGDHRTGARSPEDAAEIAEAVDQAAHLELRGLQAYSVLGSHAGGLEERKRVSAESFQVASRALGIMLRRGLSTEIVTGGSTGTWEIDTAVPDLTELQAGSYVLMDLAYRREGLDFENALTVLATVVSANHPGFVTVDAGYKGLRHRSRLRPRGGGSARIELPLGRRRIRLCGPAGRTTQARRPPGIHPAALRSHNKSLR